MALLRSLLPVFAFAAVYAAIALWVENSYYQLMLTLVLVWACFGLSWNIFSGYTGLVSFGHAAFFGIGAYTTALGQIHFDISPWFLIPAAGVLGGLAGLLIGLPTFRLRGVYFALAMLAYPLAMLYVFEWLGYQEVTLPMKREAAGLYMQFADHRIYVLIALAMLIGIVIVTRIVERSRFGMALIAIKQNEAAAEAAGIDTFGWKLRAIALSGAIAGATGAFYAVVLLVVTPVSVFGMLVSAQALTVTMFGGVGTVWGPVIGAAILIPVAETLHAELGARFPGIQGVIFGLAIVVVILAAPEGVFWKVRDVIRRWRPGPTSEGAADSPALPLAHLSARAPAAPGGHAVAPEVILEVQGLSKSFGGLKAVQDVGFKVHQGMILGIIGPNGAGKTTLFNLLNGFLKPDAGAVLLDGRDRAGQKPHRLCAAGVGRTFQVMRPFPRMSVADNVRVGAYVRARDEAHARELAEDAIARVGLSAVKDRQAAGLPTRELRLMEIARALAGQPRILLLDETLAGLGHGETLDVVAVIRTLAADGITIVIIEHTMQAMVRLADHLVVLDHGAVLVDGAPEAVTRDPRVIEAYLGKKWSAYAAA
jgi:ABC-type branched-subunit amino acid transport system ATPase component/ABC-type branched-subunit amino acid transport system permease subunit